MKNKINSKKEQKLYKSVFVWISSFGIGLFYALNYVELIKRNFEETIFNAMFFTLFGGISFFGIVAICAYLINLAIVFKDK